MHSEVSWFFDKPGKWQKSYQTLREILLQCDLVETLKWGCPCYTYNGNNIVLIHGFKVYCALLFMQGVLLKDPRNLLVQQSKNVQSSRQLRFSGVNDILNKQSIIADYVREAIEVSKAGLKVALKETSDYDIPEEFRIVLQQMPELETAFYNLTPGRQRGYLLYFSSAKQSKTRMDRIERYISKILALQGIND